MSTQVVSSESPAVTGPPPDFLGSILAGKGALASMADAERERLLGEVLARPANLGPADSASGLATAVDCFLADLRPQADGWRACVPASGGGARSVPFLPELARRLLARGYLHRPEAPDEDPLLNPEAGGAIDPECRDEGLALARVVVATEQERSGLLASVVGRRLAAVGGAGAPALRWAWLEPLVLATEVQCLLTAALAATFAPPQAAPLWRLLLGAYEHACVCRSPDWPASHGPLAACCALGLALTRPQEQKWLHDLGDRVSAWRGWQDGDAWPIRHPAADLPALLALLTDRACLLLGVPDRRFWPSHFLHKVLGPRLPWPPLERFCVGPRLIGPG